MATLDPSKQQPFLLPHHDSANSLSATCTGQLSALVKGTEFFALLKVLRASARENGVTRAAAADLLTERQ